MTVFPFPIGEVAILYDRVLKTRTPPSDAGSPERKDVVSISAEAKRRKYLEETRSDTPLRVQNGG